METSTHRVQLCFETIRQGLNHPRAQDRLRPVITIGTMIAAARTAIPAIAPMIFHAETSLPSLSRSVQIGTSPLGSREPLTVNTGFPSDSRYGLVLVAQFVFLHRRVTVSVAVFQA